MIRWDDPNPVFFDMETQSAADLKAVGGRLYAQHPTTRVLSGVFLIDGVFHCWYPLPLTKPIDPVGIWPAQLGTAQQFVIYLSVELPEPIRAAAAAGRTFVAHNCFGFDRHIWEYVIKPGVTPNWADSIPLARTAGFPGALNKIAKEIVNEGKDAGHRILMKCCKAKEDPAGPEYPNVMAGDAEVILRYNLADVELMKRAWDAFAEVPVEGDVIETHVRINDRGIGLDEELARKLVAVSAESVDRAASQIAALTDGVLNSNNLRSVKQVNEWLDTQGVRIRDYTGRRTLRKDFVEQAIANPWTMLDEDSPVAAVSDINPKVFEVLRLRSAALRITSAKGERALARTSPDGRARDLFSYWQAHTGRWSSAGIQVHNLPRPRKGVPVAELLAAHESGAWPNGAAGYDFVASLLKPGLSVDDALASLIRPLFRAAPGAVFSIADYAAIECRGVAWNADEEALLHTLASGGDVYKEMASQIFGVPVEQVTDGQRQVGKVTVLGCGYSMSAEKFRLYCGLQGIDLAAAGTTAEKCVDAFRGKYQRIAGTWAGQIDGKAYRTGGLWSQLAKAAMSATSEGGIHKAGKTAWVHDGKHLLCHLPSGRILRYRNARIEDRVPGYAKALGLDRAKASLVYDGEFHEQTLYGGKITENIVQAECRDVMATALVQTDQRELNPVAHVHDEILTENPEAQAAESLNALADIMTTVPTWAPGFPIAVEGFASPRYLKAAPPGFPKVHKKSAKMC